MSNQDCKVLGSHCMFENLMKDKIWKEKGQSGFYGKFYGLRCHLRVIGAM